jgi:hypothetical protein
MTLTAERLREVLTYDPDTGLFSWRDRQRSDFKTAQGYGAWRSKCLGMEAGGSSGHGYRRISIDCEEYFSHRLAWLYVHGAWPSKHIDHINGDGSDNRIANLRDVTNTDNRRNCKRSKNNTSGICGIYFRPKYGTWTAKIWERAKGIHLGSFATEEAAIAARRQAEERLGYHPNHGRTA